MEPDPLPKKLRDQIFAKFLPPDGDFESPFRSNTRRLFDPNEIFLFKESLAEFAMVLILMGGFASGIASAGALLARIRALMTRSQDAHASSKEHDMDAILLFLILRYKEHYSGALVSEIGQATSLQADRVRSVLRSLQDAGVAFSSDSRIGKAAIWYYKRPTSQAASETSNDSPPE